MTDYWTRTFFIELYRMKKTLNYLYYIAFIIVFLVLIDTIFTSDIDYGSTWEAMQAGFKDGQDANPL
ncbi:hypothetical protein [Psychroflexus gondwanensis]|nr:hypothetical protein [Psychroflexus gondwanensis]